MFSVKYGIFSYPSVLTFVLGAQKNRLIETVVEFPQHMFWLRNKKKNTFSCAVLSRGPISTILVVCIHG